MWKLVRIIPLLGTVFMVSEMHAAGTDPLRRVVVGDGETLKVEEIVVGLVLDELAAYHAVVDVDVCDAYAYVQEQRRLGSGATCYVCLQAGRSPVFNAAMRFFALRHAVRVYGDMMDFAQMCSIMTTNEGKHLFVSIDISSIDAIGPYGRLAMQYNDSLDFLSAFINALSAWVDREESITLFGLSIEGLPKRYPSLPIRSRKLAELSLDSRDISLESCRNMLLPNLERLKLHVPLENAPRLETLHPFCPLLKSIELF